MKKKLFKSYTLKLKTDTLTQKLNQNFKLLIKTYTLATE